MSGLAAPRRKAGTEPRHHGRKTVAEEISEGFRSAKLGGPLREADERNANGVPTLLPLAIGPLVFELSLLELDIETLKLPAGGSIVQNGG